MLRGGSLGSKLTLAIMKMVEKRDSNKNKDGSRLLQDLVAQGKLGVKSGEGFYSYRKEEIPGLIKDRDSRYIRMVQCMDSFEEPEK